MYKEITNIPNIRFLTVFINLNLFLKADISFGSSWKKNDIHLYITYYITYNNVSVSQK